MKYSTKLNKFFDNEEDLLKAEKEYDNELAEKNNGGAQAGGVPSGLVGFAIFLVLGLFFAPIIVVLGMFGKFLLGGLFKNVLSIKAFKIFRIIYTIINIIWLVLGLAAVIVLAILESEAVEIAFYTLVGGNVLLFILSIVIGDIIYKKHKNDTISQGVEQEKNR